MLPIHYLYECTMPFGCVYAYGKKENHKIHSLRWLCGRTYFILIPFLFFFNSLAANAKANITHKKRVKWWRGWRKLLQTFRNIPAYYLPYATCIREKQKTCTKTKRQMKKTAPETLSEHTQMQYCVLWLFVIIIIIIISHIFPILWSLSTKAIFHKSPRWLSVCSPSLCFDHTQTQTHVHRSITLAVTARHIRQN